MAKEVFNDICEKSVLDCLVGLLKGDQMLEQLRTVVRSLKQFIDTLAAGDFADDLGSSIGNS